MTKARVIITGDGQIGLFIDEGSYAEGKEKIDALLQYLAAAGVQLEDITPVEQHKAEDDLLHELSHATQ